MYEKNILIYWSGGQPITAPREYGITCSRAPQPWQGGELPRVQLSAHQTFCWAVSGDWTANPLVIGRPHSPLRHGQPKYKCKNVWKRHAFKCLTKTRIQMYDKNTHTNVWQKRANKHAYNCMTKTRIQNRIQMYDKNTHTNVWQKQAYKNAYKCMTKTRIQMYDKNAYKCMTKTQTNVWQKHTYKCMRKTRIQTGIQIYKKNA